MSIDPLAKEQRVDPKRLCAYVIQDTWYDQEGLFIHLDKATPGGRAEAERKYLNLERVLEDGEEYTFEQRELKDLPVETVGETGEGLRAYIFEHDTTNDQEIGVVLALSIADAAHMYRTQCPAGASLITGIKEKPIKEGVLTRFIAEYY